VLRNAANLQLSTVKRTIPNQSHFIHSASHTTHSSQVVSEEGHHSQSESESDSNFESEHDETYEVSNSAKQFDNSVESAIRDWVIKFNVSKIAVSNLLKILKSHKCFSHLPTDSRSFLQTPLVTPLRFVPPGNYCHFGLDTGVLKSLSLLSDGFTGSLKLFVNVDGLPVFKSSNQQLWPILGRVNQLPYVFPIGIYYGNQKPQDSNLYLSELISDLKSVTQNGISVKGKSIAVNVAAFICDAPARALISCIKCHTGYYGCSKCTVKGKYVENRVVYTKANSILRTDDSFRQQTQNEHHNGRSIIEELNINMVNAFPYEYMHLVCLGVKTAFNKGTGQVESY